MEDVEVPRESFEDLRARGLRGREVVFGLGFSCGIHAVMLVLSVLANAFFLPPQALDAPFLTVSLIQPAGFGEGSNGGRHGSGAGPRIPAPPSSGGGGDGPIESVGPSLPEASSIENTAGNEARISPEIGHQPSTEPVKPQRSLQMTHASRKRAVPRAAANGRFRMPALNRSSPPAAPDPSPSEGYLSPAGEGSSIENGMGSRGVGRSDGGPVGGSGGGGAQGSRGGSPGELDSKQVDVPPTVSRKVEPEFPQVARRMGISGRVVLKLLVKRDGSVGKASVIEAKPQGIFETSALEAIHKWRFNPGRHRGDAVATWVVQPIQFRLTR